MRDFFEGIAAILIVIFGLIIHIIFIMPVEWIINLFKKKAEDA